MKFTMPVNWNEGWREVQAEIVDVAPHLANVLTFAMYRNPPGSLRSGRWSIGNVETGLHIRTAETRREVVAKARSFLADKTVRIAERALRKEIKKNGQIAAELSMRVLDEGKS